MNDSTSTVAARSRIAAPSGRTVLRTAMVVGLAELGFATVIPLLPLYLTERLGASVKLVGAVVASFALVETVFKTAWGSLADRIGRRPTMIAGLVLSSLAPLVMSVLRVPILFIPLRLVDGIGSSALWPSASAIIADTSPPDGRATAMGALNMWFLAGLALGPALGLYVVGFTGNYASGFYLASFLLATSALVGIGTLRGVPDHGAAAPTGTVVGYHGVAPKPHFSDVVESARLSPLLFVMFMVAFVQMFAVGLLAPIMVIYAKRVIGLPEHLIGTLFLLLVLSVAAASVPAGRLADTKGKRRTVAGGMVLGSAGMWVLQSTPSLGVLTVGAIMLGGSYALASPAWHALVSRLAPPGRIGLAMGASQTAEGLGLVLGPLLGGVLWDALGHRAPFVAAAILLTAGTVVLLISLRVFPQPQSVRGRR
ncbi:MAG: MFS transporter [Armatimonadetes bacterium]|nr:MFS transporter [Armatimonadota bacterium]